MIHNNGAFPAIKGNPTTNYCITPDDEIREKIHRTSAMISGKSWPPLMNCTLVNGPRP